MLRGNRSSEELHPQARRTQGSWGPEQQNLWPFSSGHLVPTLVFAGSKLHPREKKADYPSMVRCVCEPISFGHQVRGSSVPGSPCRCRCPPWQLMGDTWMDYLQEGGRRAKKEGGKKEQLQCSSLSCGFLGPFWPFWTLTSLRGAHFLSAEK